MGKLLSLQKTDAMTIKETIKSLIALKQQEIPVPYNLREVELPLNAKKIITVVGVRRCGKSTLMELCIERILKAGVSPRQIAWIGFDDERFDQMQTSDFNSILEAYMEMYPDIP
ncbi:MAG: AAA family ATPase, partial [Bacteroidales bacterium]|nr:AAA family ATPase [Bacteroidales bacterium]